MASDPLSPSQRRKNEIDAMLSGYWARADQAWLDVLLNVSDDASDADKAVVWATVEEIAWVRGWKWSHGEGRWVRKVAPDGQIPDSGPKTPPEASWDPTWARPEDLQPGK